MDFSTRTLASLVLGTAFFTAPALAARPNLTGAAAVTPASVAVGDYASFDAQMCNTGTGVASNAYLSTLVPTGMAYSIASQPRGGSCRAVRYTTGTYLYCMVTVHPAVCVDLVLNVAPSVVGDTVLSASADANNLIRETDETDNIGSVTLTAY